MHVGELRPLPIFAGLSDAQLEQLIEGGSECPVQPGVELFHEGEPADVWWVLLEGAIG